MLKFRSLPVRIIETSHGALLRRGRSEVEIGSARAKTAVRTILGATSNKGLSIPELCTLFSKRSRPSVRRLVALLIEWQFLVPEESIPTQKTSRESNLDVFYWDFQECAAEASVKLNQHQVAILGVTTISRHLVSTLLDSGFTNFVVFDHPDLRNTCLYNDIGILLKDHWPSSLPSPSLWKNEYIIGKQDCLVVTSDEGTLPLFFEYNRLCIKYRRIFFPVHLEHFIGYLGPFVVPGETPCFACLQARLTSNDQGFAIDAPEKAPRGAGVSGFHPSMPAMLGNLAAFEIMRFYLQAIWPRRFGQLIEIDLLNSRMLTRKIFKVPRCSACSGLNSRPFTAIDKAQFVPPAGWEL